MLIEAHPICDAKVADQSTGNIPLFFILAKGCKAHERATRSSKRIKCYFFTFIYLQLFI
jgi:hypothetical protein